MSFGVARIGAIPGKVVSDAIWNLSRREMAAPAIPTAAGMTYSAPPLVSGAAWAGAAATVTLCWSTGKMAGVIVGAAAGGIF